MKRLIVAAALLLTVPFAWAGISEGIEYEALANPQPTDSGDKIEVLELFWYGCPHCYHLEPELNKWLETKPDDVVFIRMPAVLGPSWELYARAYYTAELLGVTDTIHPALFKRIHKDKKPQRNAAELKAFFIEQGVSESDFDNTFGSFAVVTKTNGAKQVRDKYGITGVPSLVVDGKYRTSAQQAGGNPQIIDVINQLIEMERAPAARAAAE